LRPFTINGEQFWKLTEGRHAQALGVPERDDWMVIGRVVGPFGVRGELKVQLETDFPERFRGLKRVYVGGRRRRVSVLSARLHKSQALLRLQDIETPEDVRALVGQDILVPRAEAVELPPGHFWLSELLGATVYDDEGGVVGRITDVVRTGGNDVWVVNEGRDAILVPATKDAVVKLDLAVGVIVVARWAVQPPT
jgi:16S rRNA processing protein RimM